MSHNDMLSSCVLHVNLAAGPQISIQNFQLTSRIIEARLLARSKSILPR
jgi:hypothetical protein